MAIKGTGRRLWIPSWRRVLPLALLLVGCGADDDVARADGPVPLAVFAGCEREFHGACDVLDGECQRRLFSTARCLRSQPDAPLPAVRVITAEQLLAEVMAMVLAESEMATEADEESALDDASVTRALELLGLAQPGELSEAGAVQVFIDTVPAYYSELDDLVTIVEGSDGDAASKTLTLLHEFVHALQARDRSLADLNVEATATYDAYLAALSVAEGEATMLESFVEAAQSGLLRDPDYRRYYTSWLPSAEEFFAEQSPLLVSPRYFPYSYGARYVFDVLGAEGRPGVRERFRAPPASVLPMLLNEAGLVEIQPESLAELTEPAPPPGFEPHAVDQFGPWVFGKFLERVLPEAAELSLASHWRGDRFLAWSSDAEGVAAVWTIRLDTEAAARALFEPAREGTLAGVPSANAFCSRAGRDVSFGVTDLASTREPWIAAVEGTGDAAAEPSASREGAPNAAAPRVLRPRLEASRGLLPRRARRAPASISSVADRSE